MNSVQPCTNYRNRILRWLTDRKSLKTGVIPRKCNVCSQVLRGKADGKARYSGSSRRAFISGWFYRSLQSFSQSKPSKYMSVQRMNELKKQYFGFSDVRHYVFVLCVLLVLGKSLSKSREIQLTKKSRKEHEQSLAETLKHRAPGSKGQRIPWPVLHRHITEIREGKRSLGTLLSLYEQVKVFYVDDWLLLIEIGKILSIHTNHSLNVKGKVENPQAFRDEVLNALFRLRSSGPSYAQAIRSDGKPINDSSTTSARVPFEVQHLLDVIIEDVVKSTFSSSFLA